MIYALASLAILAASWVGWGLLTLRVLGLGGALSLPEHGFVGALVVAALGSLLHLFVPLGTPVATAVCCVGVAAALALARGGGRAGPGDLRVQALRALLLALLFAAVAISIHFGGPPFDTGLYHVQAILWLRESPLTPGLANLEVRLGFNTSWFTVAALAWVPVLEMQAAFAVNGVLIFLFGWALLDAVLDPRPGAGLHRTLAAVLLLSFTMTPAGREVLYRFDSAPSTDVPAAACTLLAFVVAARPGARADRLLLLALGLLAVTVKLSQAPVLLLAVAGGLRVGRRGAALLGTSAAAWLATGLVTSGCLAFPNAASCLFPLPWRVPAETAASIGRAVASWARRPGEQLELAALGAGWLEEWLQRFAEDPLVIQLAVCGLLGAGLGAFALRSGRVEKAAWVLPLVAAAGGAFWFFTAPDLRFGLGFVAALPLSLLAIGLAAELAETPAVLRGRLALVSIGLGLLAFEPLRATDRLAPAELLAPPPLVRRAHVASRRTRSGLEVGVPVQGEHSQCWAAPRPCTSKLDPGLEAFSVWGRSGFRIRR